MFAYVFWHTLKPGLPKSDYEEGLAAFARALPGKHCPGVGAAGSFRISAVPWLGDQAGYEDWLLVDGPGTLETVNVAAVSGDIAPLHARIAPAMDLGHGGLYYHLWGDLSPFSANAAQWLTRPRGIAFQPPLERIARSAGQPVSVWRRFMVLGPGREFLVLGHDPLTLDVGEGWEAHAVQRAPLASAAAADRPTLLTTLR